MKMINKKLVLKASAGTGKTYRLSLEYVAALLKGVDFRKILVMTFTRKATAEIKNAVLEKIETIINLYTEDKENEKFISLEESIKNIDSTIILDDKNIEKLKEIYSEILKNKEGLKNIQDMEVGLENRLYESALKNLDFNCFFNEILSKRLTISRLQRILLHILLGLTKDVTNNTKFSIPFVKILGFSKKGQEYLNFLKKTDSYKENKILTSNRNLKEFLNEEEKFLFEFNERCSQIYRIKSNYDNLNYPIIFKGD